MRLVDLDPKWLTHEGRRVGFVFRSPTNRQWWQTCFAEAGFRAFSCDACKEKDQWHCEHGQFGLCEAAGVDPSWIQPCNTACAWKVSGGIESADFETLTVSPSLDGSAGGLWHGFIQNGEIVGGL